MQDAQVTKSLLEPMLFVYSSMPYGPSDPHKDKQSCMCVTVTDLLKTANTK